MQNAAGVASADKMKDFSAAIRVAEGRPAEYESQHV